MKISQLRRFVAVVAEDVHFPRAAETLGIPLASLYTSMEKLEAEVGHPLFTDTKTGKALTPAGKLLLDEAKRHIAEAPAPATKSAPKTGGKAKASKGKGRTPVVKGQPKPYRKRQGR